MTQEHCTGEGLEQVFRAIHKERMAGLPILNPALHVQAVGFRQLHSHSVGILITPWFMNLIALPSPSDKWQDAEAGDKREFEFPSGTCEMDVCEEEQLGRYLSHPLFSPMGGFTDQQQAVTTAESAMERIMTPPQPTQQETQPEPGRRALLRGIFSSERG